MLRIKRLLLWSLTVLMINSCQIDEPIADQYDNQLTQTLRNIGGQQWKAAFTLPDADDYSAIPQDPRNPISAQKVALGRLLFHEPGLGTAASRDEGMNTYSCASCHFAGAGFQANRWQGIGDGGMGASANGMGRDKHPSYEGIELDVQPIRSPAALNVAYQRIMLWNGQFGATGPNQGTEFSWTEGTPKAVNQLGYEGVETQAIAGLGVHRQEIDTTFLKSVGYLSMFDEVFPDFPREDRYSVETAGLAIAAYERTLLANEAPFQQWLKGNQEAMSNLEKQGAILFFGRAQCVDCHNGPALSSEGFYALGMKDLNQNAETVFRAPENDPTNLGRGGFTGRTEDNYKFKVPQLYNLGNSPFYGHGGSLRSIFDVVDYKNKARAENERVPTHMLATEFQPLGLSNAEVEAITAFISHSLRDEQLERYVPEVLPSGHCFPFADEASKVDLGCQ